MSLTVRWGFHFKGIVQRIYLRCLPSKHYLGSKHSFYCNLTMLFALFSMLYYKKYLGPTPPPLHINNYRTTYLCKIFCHCPWPCSIERCLKIRSFVWFRSSLIMSAISKTNGDCPKFASTTSPGVCKPTVG